MRFRNTFAIGALFLALAGYLYFVENPRQRHEAEAKKLLHFEPRDVSEVTLTYPDQQIVVKRTAAGWHLQKPVDVDADQTAVDNLVRAIADVEVKRTVESDGTSLGVYGLDKPETIVSVELSNGKKLPAIRVGKTAPVGFSAYAQLEGSSEVKLVPSVFHSGMKRDVKDLRNKTVIDFKDEDVRSIELATPQSLIEVVRDGSRWKIDKPATLAADPTEIRGLLSSLRGVRAEDFVDAPTSLADYGLDAPREKIAVVLGKDKARKELWIGAEKADKSKNMLYVKRPDAATVYAVGSWNWGSLNKDVSALRDKTVLPFDLETVAAIEVTRRDGEAYRLVKEAPAEPAGGASAAAQPTHTPAEVVWTVSGEKRSKTVQIDTLAGDLHGLKGYEIAAEKPENLAAYGLAAPELTFSLIDAAGKPIGRILVGQVGVGGGAAPDAYAMADGGDVVYRIRGYLYSHLDKKKEDFLEAPPATTPSPTATTAR
jgi:Domain of unknown function (DUF4340)